MSWPLVLAGPVVRRVDLAYTDDDHKVPQQIVAVWIALSKKAKITLRVYDGQVSARSAGAPLFSSDATDTLRIGEQLHIALVVAQPPGAPMTPGRAYSYDLAVDAGAGAQTLDALGLLKDGPLDGKPHLALGYSEGMLPSFCTAPPDLVDLRVVHGSCRKVHGDGRDAMEIVDQLIQADLGTIHRPHQLFLTGDQIYADEVPVGLSPQLSSIGGRLLYGDTFGGAPPQTTGEQLPVQGKLYACDQALFPSGRRQRLCYEEARFTSTEARSHLFGFGEYAAMYLCSFANVVWPVEPPTKPQPRPAAGAVDSDPVRGDLITRFDAVDQAGATNLVGSTIAESVASSADLADRYDREIDRVRQFYDVLPNTRRVLANVPTYCVIDDHEITDDFYLGGLWKRRVLASSLGRTIVRNGLVAYGLFQGWGNDPIAFAKSDSPNGKFLATVVKLFPMGAIEGPDPAQAAALESLLGMTDAPPPELGGDYPFVKWSYLVKGPRHLVIVLDTRTRRGYDSPYAPPRLLDYDALLDQIPGDAPPAGEPPPYAGGADPLEKHGVDVAFVIVAAPVLGFALMEELIEPAYQKYFNMFHIVQRSDPAAQGLSGELAAAYENDAEAPAFNVDGFESLLRRLAPLRRVVLLSGDLHYGFTAQLTYWQKQGGQLQPAARFAQLVASSVKNESGFGAIVASRLNQTTFQAAFGAFAFPVEKLAWLNHSPAPITLPAGETPPFAYQLLLERDPVVVPTRAWPAGASTSAPADWGWRMSILRDERPDDGAASRPSAVRTPLGAPDVDATFLTIDQMMTAYGLVAARHVQTLRRSAPRRVVWSSNVGLISFSFDGSALTVQHELHYFVDPSATPGLGGDGTQAGPFTVHRVLLDPSPEPVPGLDTGGK